MTPVPGPISSTGRPDATSITEAIRRAVTELVGTIEPTAFGLSIQPLKKRSSSSNFVASDFRNPVTRGIDHVLRSAPGGVFTRRSA